MKTHGTPSGPGHSLLEARSSPAAAGTGSWNHYATLSQKFFGNLPVLCHLNP